MKRQRATVIVAIERQIVLVENGGGLVLLPGGGIQEGESALQAAVRELAEETGLVAQSMQFLFRHESVTNCHNVFLAVAAGSPVAGDDATALHYFDGSQRALRERMSAATSQILARFLAVPGTPEC